MKQKETIEVIQAKQMLKVIEDEFNPKIIQSKIDEEHKDSFFYDGTIAQITKPNGTELFLMATGEIRIYKKDGELVFDGEERNSGFDFELTDKTLSKRIGSNYDDEYYWDMNNWFEVTWKKKDNEFMDSAMGDVTYDYNGGIELLKSYFEDDRY